MTYLFPNNISMKNRIAILVFSLLIVNWNALTAQNVNQMVSGPVLGPVELRTATILMEVKSFVKKVSIQYKAVSLDSIQLADPGNESGIVNYNGTLGKEFNPIKLLLGGLKMNTTYEYKILADGKELSFDYKTQFTTKDLWQWRKPVPDFSFLTGSCAYFNETVFDRPGKPYGGDPEIFKTMAGTPASFMLWLGDNWYYREVDYFDKWGLYYRPSRDRSLPSLQKFWASMSQYAIWDDHDYGPNDSDKTYPFKEETRQVFMDYWANPSYGQQGKGIYTKFSFADADFFLLDDRWFRSNDGLRDSIDGKPNPTKKMWGDEQMEWLKNSLRGSNAPFKFIVNGSQVLNPLSPYDCVRHYPVEYQELLNFIKDEKITGILFISGDRHTSEITKIEREGIYPLYDITASPLTSGSHKFSGREKQSPYRIYELAEKQNFSKISITGLKGKRKLVCNFIGVNGEDYGSWSIMEEELKIKKGE